jgi:alpha-L-fucosidase
LIKNDRRFSLMQPPRLLPPAIALSCLVLTAGGKAQTNSAAGDLVTAPPVPRKSAVSVTKESEERLKWWREARFGMFVHFGLYSISGGGGWDLWHDRKSLEEYATLTDKFTADKFNAKEWVDAAKSAGMQYLVMVTKHHDGFALFNSKDYPFNSVNSAAKRDFVKEVADAAHAAGLRLGFYYSPLDWQYPGYFFPDLYRKSAEAMRDKYHRQVEELMSNYGKVDILWYDGGGPNWLGFGGLEFGGTAPGWHARDRSKPYDGKFSWNDNEINAKVRQLQPGILINDRTATPADFETREGEGKMGDYNDRIPWEHCVTLAVTWGYQKGRPPMPLEKCIRLLVGTAGRDGNLLLNVGPRPDGQIEPDQLARFREIGDWLKTYGESIYGTRGGPFLPWPAGISTRKGNTIYVHLLDAVGSMLRLPAIPAKVRSVSVIDGPKCNFKQDDKGIEVTMPKGLSPRPDTVVALELDGPASKITPLALPTIDMSAMEGVRVEQDVDYLGMTNSPKADLYSPTNLKPGQTCPAVVIIHGGGWCGGDKAQKREQNIGATLARAGYVCMSINYVLAGHGEPATWPRNLQQCKTAVRWLRANAARLHIDPSRIGAIGGSAGGHLVSMLGVTGPFDGLDPSDPHGEYSCQVQAVVDMYGPADLMTWHDSVAMGGKRSELPEIYRQGSPVTYTRKGNPPFLILHGTKDATVPIEQSKIFDKALTKAGVEHQFVILEGAEHTFDLQPPQRDLRPLVIGFFDRYLKKH